VGGLVTSGAWGHRVGASLGMGGRRLDEPITAERLAGLSVQVEVAARPVGARLQLAPHYDPSHLRVRTAAPPPAEARPPTSRSIP
jgi:4-methylaminobutanoate oxidase (formaldehyde-forming)